MEALLTAAGPYSYLFVPGSEPRRFDKACASGADAVIIDLEDAVAPGDKAGARDAVAAWLRLRRRVIVRINAVDTRWFDDDVALCGLDGVAGVMLPKAESCEVLLALAARLPTMPLLPLVESARGFSVAGELARCPQVQRLVFGSIDFQLDLGIDGEGDELLYFRSGLVLASRLAGIAAPVDGVTVAVSDPARLEADARRARRLGFGGKLCIHPNQLATVNTAFAPSAAEMDWARKVVAAAEVESGAFRLDGKMVDRPVILRAQAVLRAHAARTCA
ncbi:CoA ester lyase [Duganella sp. BuS-21]|uniref:HpcH/HpaI aldolase/citrate lyase family protein n=1 Tax=Duganella sp. BuS-21 TaxID=2943848 RepID=UPI0035A6E19B